MMTGMTASSFLDEIRTFLSAPGNQTPHGRFLGMDIVYLEHGRAVVRLP